MTDRGRPLKLLVDEGAPASAPVTDRRTGITVLGQVNEVAVPAIESLLHADSYGFTATDECDGPVVVIQAETDIPQLEKLAKRVSEQERLVHLNPGFRNGCLRTRHDRAAVSFHPPHRSRLSLE
jgi:hypothetical protein